MKREKVITVLACLGVDPAKEQKRTGWLVAHCPLGPWRHGGEDKNPSFGVKEEAGDNHCHCFSCGYGGSLSDLVEEVGAMNKIKPQTVLDLTHARSLCELTADDIDFDIPDIEQTLFGGGKKKPFHEFPSWFRDSFKPVNAIPWARDYLLHGREQPVPEALWSHYDLRADTGQKRICIPVYDFDGRLAGMHGRAVEPENPMRYRMYTHNGENNPIVWLGEHWIDFERPVIWVEGYFDLLSVARVYENVVSPLFANPSFDKMDRMADSFEIVTLYDHGKGGDNGRERVSKWAKKRIVKHVRPPKHRKDAGDMTVPELVAILGEIVPLRKKLVV